MQHDAVSPAPPSFASLLTAERRARKLSIGKLAARITMPNGKTLSRQYVSLLEQGKRHATEEMAIRLARVLDADPAHFAAVAARDRGDVEPEAADPVESANVHARAMLGYVFDLLDVDVTVQPNGDTMVVRTYLGCRQAPGAPPVRELLFSEVGGSPQPSEPPLRVLKAPAGMSFQVSPVIVRGNVRAHRIELPNGLSAGGSALGAGFSLSTKVALAGLFSPDETVGVLSFNVAHPMRRLHLRLRLVGKQPLPAWDKDVRGRNGTLPIEAVPAVAVTKLCRTIAFEADGYEACLNVTGPVLNATFAISWRSGG